MQDIAGNRVRAPVLRNWKLCYARKGISPTGAGDLAEECRLLAKSREAALEAVRVYNDPLAGFRTETFIVLMVVAWNYLTKPTSILNAL